MKLYEIPPVYRELLARIEDNDGELTEELAAQWEAIDNTLADKVDAYCAVIRQIDYDHAAYRQEARRLQLKAQGCENTIKRMKEMLMQAMAALDVSTFKGKLFFIRKHRASIPTITWNSNEEIPAPFQKIKVELDKSAALDAYHDAGGHLPREFDVKFTEFITIR